MRRVLLLFASLIILVVLAIPSYAHAQGMQYWVTARDYNTGNNAYGTKAGNYVMSSPTITSAHVNSAYIYDSGGYYMAECGWVWYKSVAKPQWFSQRVINGAIQALDLGGYPTKGTNHTIEVRNKIGTNDFLFRIDGSTIFTRTLMGVRHGETWVSSERNDIGDSNYGHFWSIQKMNSSGTYSNWTSLVNNWTTDPTYTLRAPSNTECFMELQ